MSEGNIKLITLAGSLDHTFLRGLSAYEVAVKNGYTGTESEWLASLKGDKPVKGVDYYTTAEINKVKDDIATGAYGDFKVNYNLKMNEFNSTAATAKNDFNSNSESKINSYNSNTANKTNAYNSNHITKIGEYNTNASSKTTEFNRLASEKKAEIEAITPEIEDLDYVVFYDDSDEDPDVDEVVLYSEFETALSEKANTGVSYTKSESDTKYATKSELSDKVATGTVYTKTETDGKYAVKSDLSQYTTKYNSVITLLGQVKTALENGQTSEAISLLDNFLLGENGGVLS